MVIQKNGLECNCGRKGCFEKYASMKAFKYMVQQEFEKKDLRGEEIKELLEDNKNSERTKKVVEKYIGYLSTGIANLINIFEPQIISMGGSFVYFKDILLEKLEVELNKNGVLFNNQEIPKITIAKLKNDAGIIGSVIK